MWKFHRTKMVLDKSLERAHPLSMETTTMTLIQIQDRYVETVNAGIARWSHRKDGGHSDRIRRGAYHQAQKQLASIGFTSEQTEQAIKDARDMAELERNAEWQQYFLFCGVGPKMVNRKLEEHSVRPVVPKPTSVKVIPTKADGSW
jgi:hypothetical protein